MPREVTTFETYKGTRYTVVHTAVIEPSGFSCEKCEKPLWLHSDSPNQLFTFGFMFDGVPILEPHWSPCADGWD